MRYMRMLTKVILLAVAFTAAAPTITRPAVAQEPITRARGGQITLDFQDVGLAYVFSALAEAASLNLVYANLPEAKVTLRSARPVPISTIPDLIRTLARWNRITVTDERGFLRLQGPADSDPVPDNRNLYIHRLKHARASDLAPTLQELFGGGIGGMIVPVSSVSQATSASRGRQSQQQIRRQQQQQQQRQQQAAAAAAAAARRAQQLAQGGGLQHEVQIVPDEVTNTLLVRATADDWRIIEQAVEALDLRPLQVAIEVVIAEVRRRDELQFGSRAGAGPDGATSAEDFTVRVEGTGKIDIRATLQALASTGDVHILSRPVVMAQNNREARILVGTERPFVQISRSLATSEVVRDQVIQYRDVGTVLTILPTINEEGYVNLAVTQEVSSATTETQFDAPVISTRVAETQLLARDGETVVLGGLVDRREDKIRTGLPVLRSIPILGMLFRSTRNVHETSELFLFLTPYIVANDEDARRLREGIERGADLLDSVLPATPLFPDTVPPDTVPPPEEGGR